MCGFAGCTMDEKLDPGGTARGGISMFGVSSGLAPPKDSKTGHPQILLPAWANLNLRWRARLLIRANEQEKKKNLPCISVKEEERKVVLRIYYPSQILLSRG